MFSLQAASVNRGSELIDEAVPRPCSQCRTPTPHRLVPNVLCHLGDLDETFFFFALCGLWSNTVLHALLVLVYAIQSSPTFDTTCWSLATIVWGIIALSIHYMRDANRRLKSGYSQSKSKPSSARIVITEALILVVFMGWYRSSIAQRTAPFEALFRECTQPETFGRRLCSAPGGPRGMMVTATQCDLAKAIANVTWVGPIALLLATWAMLFAWMSRPSGESEARAESSSEREIKLESGSKMITMDLKFPSPCL